MGAPREDRRGPEAVGKGNIQAAEGQCCFSWETMFSLLSVYFPFWDVKAYSTAAGSWCLVAITRDIVEFKLPSVFSTLCV